MAHYMKLLFALCFIFTTPAFAYLDPGSGSLLLSSLVAIFASFVYFFKNIFYRVVSFSPSGFKMLVSQNIAIGGGQTQKSSADSSVGENRVKNSIVFYCEGKQYYFTFKPILDALEALNHPYTYLTSDEADPALQRENPQNNIFEFIGIGNSAYTRLNFLRADICVLTTPSLQVLQIKRSRGVKHYCHIVHSLTPMTYRTFGVDYFDSVLVANAIQADFVREIERAHNVKPKHIAIVGLTYLDELSHLAFNLSLGNHSADSANFGHSQTPSLASLPKTKFPVKFAENHESNTANTSIARGDSSESDSAMPEGEKGGGLESKNTPTILVSPSWGKESLLSKYGLTLLEPLANTNYHIIIRPHPQSLIGKAESSNIKALQDALKNYKNIEWDIGTPNIYALSRADLMISDFSSVIFDFACLFQKPILTLDFRFDPAGYDLADIYEGRDIGEFYTFKALEKIGAKLKKSDFGDIKNIIDSTLQCKKSALEAIKSELWNYPHESGTRSAMELLTIEREILEGKISRYAGELSRIRELDSIIKDFCHLDGKAQKSTLVDISLASQTQYDNENVDCHENPTNHTQNRKNKRTPK